MVMLFVIRDINSNHPPFIPPSKSTNIPKFDARLNTTFTLFIVTSSNRHIFCVTGLLCREFINHRWIPCTKASDTELRIFFICAWINGCVNNREAGDLKCHQAHYDVTVMDICNSIHTSQNWTYIRQSWTSARHQWTRSRHNWASSRHSMESTWCHCIIAFSFSGIDNGLFLS